MSGRFRSAIQAYLRGHDRILEHAGIRPPQPAEAGAEPAIEWGGVPETPSFGVGVARALEFERGPGNANARYGGASDGVGSDV